MFSFFKKNPSKYSDAELVQSYQKTGDMELLGELYGRYTALVYGASLKILKNETEAEDVFSDIFEKLITKVKDHNIQQFRPWLHTVVRNHCLEILRKKKKILTVSYEPEFMQSAEVLHPFMEDLENGKMESLDNCLKTLDIEQKNCVDLFYYQKKSYKEIAEMKQVKVGKIRSYIQNGRRNLKICIEKHETIKNRE